MHELVRTFSIHRQYVISLCNSPCFLGQSVCIDAFDCKARLAALSLHQPKAERCPARDIDFDHTVGLAMKVCGGWEGRENTEISLHARVNQRVPRAQVDTDREQHVATVTRITSAPASRQYRTRVTSQLTIGFLYVASH